MLIIYNYNGLDIPYKCFNLDLNSSFEFTISYGEMKDLEKNKKSGYIVSVNNSYYSDNTKYFSLNLGIYDNYDQAVERLNILIEAILNNEKIFRM